MHEVVLPSSTFMEFLIMIFIWFILAFSMVVMVCFTWRKRRIMLERVNKELPEIIKKPLIMKLKTRPTPLLYLFLLLLLVIAIFRFWDQGFSSFQYDNEEIRLKYHNRLEPVVLNWSDIQNISLNESSKALKYLLVIQCMDGKLYKSNLNKTASDAQLMETALIQLKEAKENWDTTVLRKN